jgi:beta-glucosidase-like glycosyl hydrolase
VGSEAYYSGVDRGYSPVLQVTTDPRFGRWHENFGGDGLLVAACATAAVTGLQGDGGSGPNSYLPVGHIVAEAKHFGAYGGSSKDGAPVEVQENSLKQSMPLFPVFKRSGCLSRACLGKPALSGSNRRRLVFCLR